MFQQLAVDTRDLQVAWRVSYCGTNGKTITHIFGNLGDNFLLYVEIKFLTLWKQSANRHRLSGAIGAREILSSGKLFSLSCAFSGSSSAGHLERVSRP